jgi:hypothetical protein
MEPGDDTHEEVLEGHRSRLRRLSDRWLLTVVVVLAVVAAASIATAAHYRADAAGLRRSTPASAPTAAPDAAGLHRMGPFTRSLTVADSTLPVGPGQHGLLAVVHASAGDERPLVIVAQLTGMHPGARYSLVGNNCQSHDPNFVWATGSSSQSGSLLLATFPRGLDPNDRYWLSLKQRGRRLPTGVAGTFATGNVTPFPAGHNPCSP